MKSTEVRTRHLGRFSYLKVFNGEVDEKTGQLTYKTAFMLPKMVAATAYDVKSGKANAAGEMIPNPDIAAVKAAVQAAFEASGTTFGNQTLADIKTPLTDGDEMVRRGKKGEEFAGMMYLNAKSQNKPGVIGSDLTRDYKTDPIGRNDFFSGCWGRVHLNFYSYKKSGNEGIGAGLNNLQFVKEDTRLGGNSVAATTAFNFDDDEDDMMG